MTDLERELNRLSNLKQNKEKSKADLERDAQINCWKRQAKVDNRFLNSGEKQKAVELFENYLNNYEFANYNEITLLSDLIYEEILLRRIQDEINKIGEDKNTKIIPEKAIVSCHEVQDRILQLKERLGISKAKDKDDLTALEILEKRFDTYIPFHRNEFTTVCSKCGTPLLLRRRCDNENFQNLIHPFFSGRFYFNRRGIELVKKGIWTKEQYAFVFFTSPQYVQWCLDNENKIIQIDNVEQDKIEEFIKTNPYLQNVTVPSKILE
jgi:hypothetical protein